MIKKEGAVWNGNTSEGPAMKDTAGDHWVRFAIEAMHYCRDTREVTELADQLLNEFNRRFNYTQYNESNRGPDAGEFIK